MTGIEEDFVSRMRMRSAVTIVLLAALASTLGPASARCGAWLLKPGEISFDLAGSRYSSDDFHNVDGDRTTLPFGGLNEQRAGTASLEVGWKPKMSAFFVLPFQSVTRRMGDGYAWPTETGLGDMQLGVRRLLSGGGASVWSLELGWKAPLGYKEGPRLSEASVAYIDSAAGNGLSPADSINLMRNSGHPTLGQAQQDLSAIVRYGQSLSGMNGFVDLAGGYRYRFDEPADQIVLSGDVAFWLGRSLLVAGRYRGAIAMGDGDTEADKYTEHLVGPELRYRVDDQVDVFLGSRHTAVGANVLHKDEFYVGLSLRKTGLNRLQGFLGGTTHP